MLLPEPPIWEQSWFFDIIKQIAAVLVVLLLVLGVLRPAMRGLVARHESDIKALSAATGEAEVRYDESGNPIPVTTAAAETDIKALEKEDLLLLDAPQSYEKRLEYVKKLVDEDPRLVAQAVRTWVVANG